MVTPPRAAAPTVAFITYYVSRQYIGNLGRTENGIVSVNAYAVVDGITYPLVFKVFKPQARLHQEDTYQTKPQLAVAIIQELRAWGFRIKLVLADSLYGESGDVIGVLEQSGNESWYIMTNLEGKVTPTIAPLYSLRNWIEYGFKQVKNELGWADRFSFDQLCQH